MSSTKIKIQIKSWLFGKVLFEYEAEGNTIKETLRNAVLSGAVLRNADLSGAVLRNADLSGADLSGAVLRNADLRNAVLSGADLSGAVLSGAVLRNADLRNAVLRNADLRNAVLRNADLSGAVLSGAVLSGAVLPIFCKWAVSTVEGKIKIGCKVKTTEEWDAWFEGTETFDTSRDTEVFKRIRANYIAVREYNKFMNS